MRALMWFSLGFGAACGLAVYVFAVSALIPLGILGIVLSLGALLIRNKLFRITGVVLLGLAIGLFWFRGYETLRLAPLRELDGQKVSLTLTASDYSWETDYGIAVDGTGELAGKRVKVRMYLHQDTPLEPGDRAVGTFRLRYTAPGGLEDTTHHSASGILLLAYPDKDVRTEDGPAQWYHFPKQICREIRSVLARVFPADTVPFAQALLLGDTSLLDYGTKTSLCVSGLRHVAAVSGLHVSILCSVLFLILGKYRGPALISGMALLGFFAAVTGFSPSVVRAVVMHLLMMTAKVLEREYDAPTALALAVLCMLGVNPLAVTSVSLQLSTASVAGILCFYERIRTWLMDPSRLGRFPKKSLMRRMMGKVSSGIAISLSATVATLPLTAWYFGTVSLLSVLTNLLCLWAVTFLFCGILASCVLGALWLPLGKLTGFLFAWVARYILTVVKTVGAFPLSAVYTASPYIIAWLVFAYILLGLFLWGRKKRPGLLACCGALALCVALAASWTEPLLDNYRVTVLDVGQGQCVLLQKGGKTFMVDCGGSHDETAADTAAAMLLSQGITELDGLILTHHDRDHMGGAQFLLQRVPAQVLILPEYPGMEELEAPLLRQFGGRLMRCTGDTEITWPGATLRIFASDSLKNTNESSLCVLFQTEKCDILITGDRTVQGEESLLLEPGLPELDVLVVGHHGAHSATGEALLQATAPKTAVISVGEDNNYGHPHREVLDRLAAYGCIIRRTDREGTILIRG